MSNFKFSFPNYYWKLTAGVAAMCGLCAILNSESKQYDDALLWGCLAMSQLLNAFYEREANNHDAN